MSEKGMFNCGEPGCKGHKNFNETCSTTRSNNGLPSFDQFLTGAWQAYEDQPTDQEAENTTDPKHYQGNLLLYH